MYKLTHARTHAHTHTHLPSPQFNHVLQHKPIPYLQVGQHGHALHPLKVLVHPTLNRSMRPGGVALHTA